MNRIESRRTVALACLALAGCWPHTQVLRTTPEPTARVAEVRARSAGPREAQLEVSVDLENPGRPLTVFGAELELTAGGRRFASGRLALQEQVPQGGTARLRLPLNLAYFELPAPGAERQGVPVVIRGVLRATCPPSLTLIEFDAETQLAGAGRSEAQP